MKKHSVILEILIFSVIFTFLIIPPFFTSAISENNNAFTQWKFPLQQLILSFLALSIFYFFYEKKKTFLKLFPSLLTFGLLFTSGLFFKFLSLVLISDDQSSVLVVLPASVSQWICCLLNFFLAAFYEEIIYRFYFTDQLISLVTKIKNNYLVLWICEIAGCLVFAFAHSYLGFLAVLNSAVAHVILRTCYKKSSSIWFCVIPHFFYNVISLILL